MIAYQVVSDGLTPGGEGVCWRSLTEPPYLEQLGQDALIRLPLTGRARAYVNGLRVIGGLQIVREGDLVTIVEPFGKQISYVVFGWHGQVEPGNGRRCSFTGRPIDGAAVRCFACGRVVAEAVATRIEACPGCKSPLGSRRDARLPVEELL